MSIGEAKMSEKLCFELIKQFWYFKNSNNGIGKLVVFLNGIELGKKPRRGVALDKRCCSYSSKI